MNQKIFILSIIVLLVSCEDIRKSQPVPDDVTKDFEIVEKKEQKPEKPADEPVSVSSILSSEEKPSAQDGDICDMVSSSSAEDPFGGDVNYLNGSDSEYDY